MDALIDCHDLAKSRFVKACDDGKNFIGLAIVNQINRALIIQKPVFGIKPNAGFICRIELAQSVNNVAQIRYQQLSARVGCDSPLRPARCCCWGNPRDIRDIRPLQPALVAEVVYKLGYSSSHYAPLPRITKLFVLPRKSGASDLVRFPVSTSMSAKTSFISVSLFFSSNIVLVIFSSP